VACEVTILLPPILLQRGARVTGAAAEPAMKVLAELIDRLDGIGSSPEVDEAIRLHKPLEDFPARNKEQATSLTEGYCRLTQIVAAAETDR
jgi:hypothetical protein